MGNRKRGFVPACLACAILGGCAQVETTPVASASAGPVVRPSNSPPLLSGQPAPTVAAGSAYLFRPTASDQDGDALTFNIQNKPSWATFNATSGALTGIPSAADIGIFSNILISVSDGVAVATLPTFSITVGPGAGSTPGTGTGQATLSWTAPTQNVDGSNLTDLAGFRIYYGNSPGAMPLRQTISDPAVSQFVAGGLPSGTWYFAISAFNSSGKESDLSSPGSKVIP